MSTVGNVCDFINHLSATRKQKIELFQLVGNTESIAQALYKEIDTGRSSMNIPTNVGEIIFVSQKLQNILTGLNF